MTDDDHKDLLKQLADAPYGKAQEILKAKGLWDESKCGGDPALAKTYRVRVTGEMRVRTIVTVEAMDEEEACEKASDIASARTFEWGRDYDRVEFADAEVESRGL